MTKHRIGFSIGDKKEPENNNGKLQEQDIILMQLIESIYKPAVDWPDCTMPLTTDQIVQNILEHFPGKFEERDQVTRLLNELHIPYSFNEHNRKWYWLVNPA